MSDGELMSVGYVQGGDGLREASEVVFLASAAVALTITNTALEGAAGQRAFADLDGFTQFYLQEVHSAGSNSGTKMGVQYSLDNGSTWEWLDGTAAASPPTAYVDITTSQNLNLAGWFTIAPVARTAVSLRCVFLDGGSTSHNLRMLRMSIR